METSPISRCLRAAALACSFLTIASCSTPPTRSSAEPATRAILDGPDGPATVVNLTNRYNNTVNDCGGRPAIRCSGVMFEGMDADEAWQPTFDNGIPTSWFRRDAPVLRPFFDKGGVIYYPAENTLAPGKLAADALCAFPLDGVTDARQARCGPSNVFPEESRPCQSQGIRTAEAWLAHFNSRPDPEFGSSSWQCGFDISAKAPDATAVFAFFPQLTKAVMRDEALKLKWNEVVIKSWPKDVPASVPIEAFYYPADNAEQREYVQRLQRVMNNKTRIWRPIIALKFPTLDAPARFAYNVLDQAVQPPAAKP